MLYLRVFVLFLVQISLWIVNNDNAWKQQYYIQQPGLKQRGLLYLQRKNEVKKQVETVNHQGN